MPKESFIEDLRQEHEKSVQQTSEKFEEKDTENSFIAYMTSYLSRATKGIFRNEREGYEGK